MRTGVVQRWSQVRRCARLMVAMIAVGTLCAGEAAAQRLVFGPMFAHTTDTSTSVWVATSEPMPISVHLAAGEGQPVWGNGETSQIVELASKPPRRIAVGTVTIKGLKPKTAYAGQLLVDGEPLLTVLNVSTFPAADQPTHLRLALASCANVSVDRQQWAWQAISDNHPDLMLFLGDNNYFLPGAPNDWEDPARMAYRYAELRGLASIQLLLRSTPCYAIWDDRDFGADGSDKSFPLKGDSLRVFKSFWANPGYGSDKAEGIWSTFSYGSVQLFLLDDRYWRDADDMPHGPTKSMLGQAQKAWLKRELKASKARIKVVANGGQMLGDYTTAGSFSRYPEERAELFDFLGQERIDGVVFVSGERHFSELQRLDRAGAYPLYDFTTSPLAARLATGVQQEPNPIRIASYAKGCNFGMLDIDTTIEPATITFRLNDAKGTLAFSHTVKLDELRHPAK